MNPSWGETVRRVEARAGGRCEYCRMHQSLQGATFHVEHVTPVSRGGSDDAVNLAWACPGCNLRKANRTHVVDPVTENLVQLFHPRTDRWGQHFRFDEYRIEGRTATGRATVAALEFNHERRLLIRQAEELFDLFPP